MSLVVEPVLEQALEHLSHTLDAEVLLRAPSREQARLALSRLGDRARDLALDVRIYFGFAEVRRRDGRGRIRVLAPGDSHSYVPTLELELS